MALTEFAPPIEYHYDLPTKLAMIGQIFDVERAAHLPITEEYVKKYYFINKIPYSIFHTSENSLHMGISRDGIYKPSDLKEQARIIGEYIADTRAKQVLELGGGRAANSIWLARQYPSVSFISLDFSQSQTALASKAGKSLPNFNALIGNFQDLSALRTFDLIFAVESLCHSSDKQVALQQIFDRLNPGGLFIDFDGYRSQSLSDMRRDDMLATMLVEKGMAVDHFDVYSAFCSKAQTIGFQKTHEEELSVYVVPTMRRFEHLAGKFFRRPRRARVIARILPKEFTYNAISGFLMPTLMESKAFQYWMTILQKPAAALSRQG